MKVFEVKTFISTMEKYSLEVKYLILVIFFILGALVLFHPKNVYNFTGKVESNYNGKFNYELSFLSDDALVVTMSKDNQTNESNVSTHLYHLLKLNDNTFILSEKNKIDSDVNDDLFFYDLAKIKVYRSDKHKGIVVKTDNKLAFFKRVPE